MVNPLHLALAERIPSETASAFSQHLVRAEREIREWAEGVRSEMLRPRHCLSVSQSGGCQFTTIQSAINAIKDAEPVKRPYRVKVYPGYYREQLTLKPGIHLAGVSWRDVYVHYASDKGAIIMAPESWVTGITIDSATGATNWGIVATDAYRILMDVFILGDHPGPGEPAPVQLAQGIKVTGSDWYTCFIRGIIDYLGTTGWGVSLEGNPTTPQNSDAHIEAFVDALFATTGGCAKVKDLTATRIKGPGPYRTTGTGYAVKLESTSAAVDLLLENASFEGWLGLVFPAVNAHVVSVCDGGTLIRCNADIGSVELLGESYCRDKDNSGSEDRQTMSPGCFAWVNQASDNGDSAIWSAQCGEWAIMQPGGTALSWSLFVQAIPGALESPFIFDSVIVPTHFTKNWIASGMVLYSANTGAFATIQYQGDGLIVAQYTGVEGSSTSLMSGHFPVGDGLRLRLYYDGDGDYRAKVSATMLLEQYSDLGVNMWNGMADVPTHVGYGVLGFNDTSDTDSGNMDALMRVKHTVIRTVPA